VKPKKGGADVRRVAGGWVGSHHDIASERDVMSMGLPAFFWQ
jgi:hypothetical protein